MRHTIVALFDTYGQAEEARNTLVRSGFAPTDIELQAQPEPTADTTVSHPPGVLASIERFLSGLFTSSRGAMDMERYTEAVRRGAVLVCVRAASESHAELARNALAELGALDISEREPGWDAAPDDPEARRAHSVLDELGVGNPVPTVRDVLREREEEVPVARDTLPETRNPRDANEVRPSSLAAAPGFAPNDDLATQAAIAAAGAPGAGAVMGAEGPPTVHVYSGSATANTAGAESRPAEAAGAGATGYAATSARVPPAAGSDAEAAAMPGASSYGGPAADAQLRTSWSSSPEDENFGSSVPDEYLEYEEDFRSHYDDLYAQVDTQYEDYRPAYHYGANMARDERYRERSWDDVEPEVRREWEASPSRSGDTWERFKAAVRHGWDRVTGHHHI
ncbi:hypothetical protein [Paraburkholderia phosphatilytica]|uniref:hypothetical protein n=1 Tax=Paraburkholderia phosphatilytica TaxID=2282883 RepID=UPI000E53131D|nr:hypothetical protein [Paraburkholderia phosphatilytica]